ncbi:MAG: DHH family phosphoesterase [Proteobacteria bacterium]|nr:DHH family phosphoesterase [Pseudomonadota bacterium]MBU1450811.1 DHH family phosphoesterase [Pseudomonadota bacterium]MBU2469696.1 DHH family phosphoesterase [Pseudomonadota bacterium]MBU2516843.1 DHH family phosphoesterase [Pseudomonadota bacterium]
MAKEKKKPPAKPRRPAELVKRLLAQFESEDRVLVIIAADPDALASALALKRLLWRRVTNVSITHVNQISRPDNLAMTRLLSIPLIPFAQVDVNAFSKKVMLDSQPHHNASFAGIKVDVVIDHHPVGEASSSYAFCDIRPRYGSASSILTEYIRGANIKPSSRLATALVYGIKTDTASFGRPSLLEDVRAFQYLFPKANQSVLRKIEFSEMRLKDLALLHLALDRFVVRKHAMFVHLGEVSSPDNLVQIADFFLRVDSVDTCAVSGVHQERLVVILRNAGYRTNAGRLAESAFGELGPAGGHKAMARAEMPLAAVKKCCKDTTEENLSRFVMRRLTRAAGPQKTTKAPK